MTPHALWTNDVETTSIWFNALRDETGLKVWKEGMPRLLELYERYHIRSTFFFTGYIARLYPEVVKMILPFGHEVGSHGWVHDPRQAFDVLPYAEQVKHLSDSKKLLEDLCGQEVISFRAPALRVNKDTPQALEEAGFRIDSSIASQRFDFFLSFGSKNKFKWLLAPRPPYHTAKDSLFRRGNSNILEVPLNALILPYIGTTMRIFPGLTSMLKYLLHLECKATHKPVVFLIHPNELIDESLEKIGKVPKRARNLAAYLLADRLRRALKIRNLGLEAARIYERHLAFFARCQYLGITLKEYAEHYHEKDRRIRL